MLKLVEGIIKSFQSFTHSLCIFFNYQEFDDTAPTLLLSEVVMTYMAVNSCNHILQWIPETFSNSMIAVYEQGILNYQFFFVVKNLKSFFKKFCLMTHLVK